VKKNNIRVFKTLITCLSVIVFSANSTIIEVTPSTTNWGAGDANSAITDAFARSGNGSLELQGDRTRFFGLGNPYDPGSNIGLLSNLNDFSFDWSIAASSLSNLDDDYTPALRLHIWDGQQRSELIWEGAYNNTYGNTNRDTWYETDFEDNFWQYQSGIGVTELFNVGLDHWQQEYSANAYVSAVSVGVGSSVGGDYLAFADNVTIQFDNQDSRTFNFEVDSVDVPEPSTLAIFALGMIGLASRRFKKNP
jgi:hypothetical protein